MDAEEETRMRNWKKMRAMIRQMKLGEFQEQRAVRANIQVHH